MEKSDCISANIDLVTANEEDYDPNSKIPDDVMMAVVHALWDDMIKFCENERQKREAEANREATEKTE